MHSPFLLCITRADEDPVFLRPGSVGEQNLVEIVAANVMARMKGVITDTVQRIVERGVGAFRTEAQVKAAIESELDAMAALAGDSARAAVKNAIFAAKSEVMPT